MLRVAAHYADSWSSWGGYGIETEEQMYERTKSRCVRFDELCPGIGRDPGSIRHSLVCFPPLTPWESIAYFNEMVERYRAIGVDEFVLYWPQTWRTHPHEDSVFEQTATQLMPALRKSANA